MTLRTRLRLAYGILMVLLLLATGGAAGGFYELGRGLQIAQRENASRVATALKTFEVLERQQSLALEWMADPRAPEQELARSDPAINEIIEELQAGARPAERSGIEALGQQLHAYRAALEKLLAERPDRLLSAFQGEVLPKLRQARQAAVQLLQDRNQQVLAADLEAQTTAFHSSIWLGLLAVVSLGVVILVLRWMQRAVLHRLSELGRAASAVGGENQGLRLPSSIRDELGQLAQRFNEILDARDALKQEMQGHLDQNAVLLLGLLQTAAPGATLHRLDGRLVAPATNAPSASVTAATNWIATQGQALLKSYCAGPLPPSQLTTPEGQGLRVVLLCVEAQRPAGWLVQPER